MGFVKEPDAEIDLLARNVIGAALKGCQLGLLLNFDVPFLRRRIRRVVLTTQPSGQNS